MSNRREDFIAYVKTMLNATYFRDDLRSNTKAALINLLDSHTEEMLAEQREACAEAVWEYYFDNARGGVESDELCKACLNARGE